MFIIDTETTGLNIEIHEIHEISILDTRDSRQLNIDVKVENITSISPEILVMTDKRDFRSGLEKIDAILMCNNFIKDSDSKIMLAHNASFDRKRLEKMWKRNYFEFPADKWIDTIPIIKEYVSKNKIEMVGKTKKTCKPSFRLESCIDTFNIEKPGALHSAKTDVKCLYGILKKIKFLN